TWVEIHPETAERLGIGRGDILEVKTALGTIKAPAFPYLGVHKDAIAIPIGQGHTATAQIAAFDPMHYNISQIQWGYGRYARNLGAKVLDLLPVSIDSAGGLVLTATKANISKTGDTEILPSNEGSARQHGRGIAQAINAADLNKPAGEAKETIPGEP